MPARLRVESVTAALADLIKNGDDLRADTRDFDSIGDERRALHVQVRSRWLANSKAVLRHAGLDSYGEALETLVAGTPRGPFQIAEILGLLESAKLAVEKGITTEGRSRDFGEILSDMLSLAKEAVAANTEGSKNVAAVLIAATFEETIRRMGESLAEVAGRPDLSKVIEALKSTGVLQGASLTTALGYLKFRNDALHADWDRLDRAVVASCLAFTESLLLKHFG
jgi:hypothetical protein